MTIIVTAQGGGVQISGFLRDGWKPISGSIVQLYSQGSLLMVAETDLSGRFNFDLELNREYQLIFAAFGYVTKTMTINTKVRDNEERDWTYWFNMEIFPEIADTDFSVFQLPVAKIFYSPNWGEFDFDYNYSVKIKNLSNAVVSHVRKERSVQYNTYLSQAENELKKKNLIRAIDYYLLARVCDPYFPYPIEQIAVVEKQLLKNSDLYKQYTKLQELGDSCLRDHSFVKASVFYAESAAIYPESEYAQYKLNLSDTLKNRFDNTMYKSLAFNRNVELADKYIGNSDYINARYYYKRAAELNPNDEYVFKQIKFINTQTNTPIDDQTTDQYRQLIEKGDRQLALSDYDGAIRCYNKAHDLNPSDHYVKIQIEKINKMKLLMASFSFSPESRTKKYLQDLAKAYDKGISEELREWEGKKVHRVIINDGIEAREYIKIVDNNNTQYYRNGQTITENVFRTETEH